MSARQSSGTARYPAKSVMAAIAILGLVRASASPHHLAVDIPSQLGGVEFSPTQIVRDDSGVYALAQESGIPIGALHRLSNGRWLIAPTEPVLGTGGVLWMPRDVISLDAGGAMSLYLSGASVGIQSEARIDAIASDAVGRLVLSFDVPVTAGVLELRPADVALVSGGSLQLLWDSAGHGVPPGVNTIGVDLTNDSVILTFDVPVTLGGTEFQPGTLVRAQGSSFTQYINDAWPLGAQPRDFVLPPAAGTVPEGLGKTVPVKVKRQGAASLLLTWGQSCTANDTDYEIYEGTLGSYYSHAPLACSTGGALTATITPVRVNAYYLVVPRNAVSEGSYGKASNGLQIPPGTTPCFPQSALVTCP